MLLTKPSLLTSILTRTLLEDMKAISIPEKNAEKIIEMIVIMNIVRISEFILQI